MNPADKLHQLRESLNKAKGQQEQLQKQFRETRWAIRDTQKDLENHEQALELIKAVAIQTQQQLTYHISDIVSLALDSIFPNPYELKLEFVQRRGKTECDILFNRDGESIDPLMASGGGAVDVASFALRVACWSMQNPRTAPVIILDEPFKHLSEDLLPGACATLQELSKKLKLQFIIVTHEDALIDAADRVFEVRIDKKGISRVTQN